MQKADSLLTNEERNKRYLLLSSKVASKVLVSARLHSGGLGGEEKQLPCDPRL